MIKRYTIDWEWVEKELTEKEKISSSQNGPAEAVRREAKNSITLAKSLVKPRVIYVIHPVRLFTENTITIDGGLAFKIGRGVLYMKDARDLCLFAVTIGDALELKASQIMSAGDALLGYLLDRVGSFAVESLAGRFEKTLRLSYAAKENDVSMRLSPGYCDWAIEDQHRLSRIIGFTQAGISLTEGCMMVPKKSISGAIAIGVKDIFPKVKSQCQICDSAGCSYRRGERLL